MRIGPEDAFSCRGFSLRGLTTAAIGAVYGAVAATPVSAARNAAAPGLTGKNLFSTVDGARLYYKNWGAGQPLVFSHNWPLNSDAFKDQMLFLALQGYRCIALDRRGHSWSSQPTPKGWREYIPSLQLPVDAHKFRNVGKLISHFFPDADQCIRDAETHCKILSDNMQQTSHVQNGSTAAGYGSTFRTVGDVPATWIKTSLPLAALLVLATALAGCVQEPQPRATVLRELDSGISGQRGGAETYLGSQPRVGVTTSVR